MRQDTHEPEGGGLQCPPRERILQGEFPNAVDVRVRRIQFRRGNAMYGIPELSRLPKIPVCSYCTKGQAGTGLSVKSYFAG